MRSVIARRMVAGVNKSLSMPILLAGLLVLAGCAGPSTSDQQVAEVTPTATATPSPKPSITPTPPAPRTVAFKCYVKVPGKYTWETPTFKSATFATLAERWANPNVSTCEVVAVKSGPYSTIERDAVAAAGYDDITDVKVLWELCARTDGPYQVNGPINDAQRLESNAALMLCPDHPSAAIMANGSPEQNERAAGLRFGDGTREVGKQVQPGTYRATGDIENCYWERMNSAGSTIDNDFILAASQVEVTVLDSDFSLLTRGCGEFVKVS